jgi:antibiotic biosynthesis monooxygenase (ABM) superfamily enzyme
VDTHDDKLPTPEQPPVPPPRHKMAILTWPGAWALITLILWALGPAMDTWPLPLRTLVVSVLMVVGLTWVVIPYLTRTFAGWLAPTPPGPNRRLSLACQAYPAAEPSSAMASSSWASDR